MAYLGQVNQLGLKKSGYAVVNPDAIRLAMHGQTFCPSAEKLVWAHADLMVRHHFAYFPGSTVVLDATNLTIDRRNEWRSRDWVRKFVVFYTSKETCICRAKSTGFPIDVIERMSRTMRLPEKSGNDVIAYFDRNSSTYK